jgi:hypothetical protein
MGRVFSGDRRVSMKNADGELEHMLMAAMSGTYGSPNWLTGDLVEALLGRHDDDVIEEVKQGSEPDGTSRN